MSRVILKKDFTDGQKLYGQELNNNFGTIEEALDGTTKKYEEIVDDVIDRRWQSDEDEPTVKFYRGNTTEINNKEKEDGQILYNTSTGETFLDNNGTRIPTGGGTTIAIQEEEPTNPATKIWINPEEIAKTVASNVIDSMDGDSHTLAPSVHAAKEYIDNKITNDTEPSLEDKAPSVKAMKNYANSLQPVLLWTNPEPSSSMGDTNINIDLSKYHYIEIEFFTDTSMGTTCFAKGKVGSNMDLISFTGLSSKYYIRTVFITLSQAQVKRAADPGVEFVDTKNIPYKIYGYKIIEEEVDA